MVGNLARKREVGRPFHRRKPLYTKSTAPRPVLFPKSEIPKPSLPNDRTRRFVCGPLHLEGIFYVRPHNRCLLSNGRVPAIEAEVEKEASKNPAFHSFAHSQDIVRVALDIATYFGADMEVCYAAALMRDMKRRGTSKGHEYLSANAAKTLLEKLSLPPAFTQGVKKAIICSHKLSLPRLYSTEARAVWEASKIFNMGAYGFESRLLPLCNGKNLKSGYADAARIYLALEPQFKTPAFVEALKESSEGMHASFRVAGIGVSA